MIRLFVLIQAAVLAGSLGSIANAQNSELSDALDLSDAYLSEGSSQRSDSMLDVARTFIDDFTEEKELFRYKLYSSHSLMSKWMLTEAEPLFEEVVKMAYQMNDSAKMVVALSGMATLHTLKGNIVEAIQLQETAKDMAHHRDSAAYFGIVANLGIAYNKTGQYDKALDNYLAAKRYYQKEDMLTNLAMSENNLGELYRERFEDYEMALTHYAESIRINKKIGNNSNLAMAYHNMSLTYFKTNQLDSAEHYIFKSINLREQNGEDGRVASDYCVLGDIYTAQGQYEKALEEYEKTLVLSEKFSITPGYYFANFGLANLFQSQNKSKEAVQFAKRALDVAAEMNSHAMRVDVYDWLYDFYRDEKNYKEALVFAEKYDQWSDSLKSSEDEVLLNVAKAEYESELAKAENQRIQLQRQAEATVQEYNRLVNIGLICFSFLLLVICLLIFNAYRIKSSALKKLSVLNSNLHQSHREVIEQKEELKKLNRLKANIVSVLGHDLRGPLSNVAELVSLLRDKSISEDEFIEVVNSLNEKTNTGLKSLDMILEWSRLKAGDSNPKIESIHPKKKVDEVIDLNRESIQEKSLKVIIDCPPGVVVPADPNQFQSIAINLISNAIKFSAKGGDIHIGVKDESSRVIFYVKDSGEGFSKEVIQNMDKGQRLSPNAGSMGEKGTGIGLRIVRDFIEAHEGELKVRNQDEGGGVVSVCFPKISRYARAV